MRTIDEIKEYFKDIDFPPKYLEILKYIVSNNNAKICIQGQAGSGKSTLLKIINYMLSDGKINVAIASSTGVASALLNNGTNLGATTLHSLFKLKPLDIFGTFDDGKNYSQLSLISSIDCFIIDEISMVSADLFDYVMSIIRYCRKNNPTRIILFGDCLQLQCVVKTDDNKIKKHYDDTYKGKIEFFSSNSFKDMNFATFLLTKIYRQNFDDDGEKFKEILNRIRVCEQTQDDLDYLNQRVISEEDFILQNESFLRIVSTNKEVMKYNKISLDSIDGDYVFFDARISGNFKETSEFKNGFYPERVIVKIGCSVMITRNGQKNEMGTYDYYNGSMGILVNCQPNEWADVELSDGKIVRVERSVTNNYEYEVIHEDNQSIVESHVTGSYDNVMIKPCSACTVFKTQGLTLNKGYIDFGWWIPNSGLYVALSRFRTINDFGLRNPIKMKDIHCSKESLEYVKNSEYAEFAFEELFGDGNDCDEKIKKFNDKKNKLESFLRENNIVFADGKLTDCDSKINFFED